MVAFASHGGGGGGGGGDGGGGEVGCREESRCSHPPLLLLFRCPIIFGVRLAMSYSSDDAPMMLWLWQSAQRRPTGLRNGKRCVVENRSPRAREREAECSFVRHFHVSLTVPRERDDAPTPQSGRRVHV